MTKIFAYQSAYTENRHIEANIKTDKAFKIRFYFKRH